MAFDLTVDHRDPKSGRIIKHTPYTCYQKSGLGQVYLRDGVFYTESGQIAPDSLVEKIAGKEVLLANKSPEAKK